MKYIVVLWGVLLGLQVFAQAEATSRVSSVYLSEDFINSELATHVKSELVKELKISLDSQQKVFFLRGLLQVPIEELRAVNLDPKLGLFHFQVTVKPETTKEGYLILDFPLNETFFYPAISKNPKRDRVFVPVQMLSLALASLRGYFAALAGDFSGFDRRTTKYKALIKSLDQAIATQKNPDALDDLKTQRESWQLKLESVPIERKQLQTLSKEFEAMLHFTGEKELNLNDTLGAHQNALVIKLNLPNLVPFLKDAELGGVRLIHDKRDGNGENYLAVDINAPLAAPLPPVDNGNGGNGNRTPLKTAPSAILRLNQALLESSFIVDKEKKSMGSKLRNLSMRLKADGLHVSGEWHALFWNIPFDTIVDFVTTSADVFEIRIRDIQVADIDFEFLSGFVLEALKNRLDHALKGICSFQYVGTEKDHSRAMQVTVKPEKLIPALPGLHLVDVDVREQEFLLKVGP